MLAYRPSDPGTSTSWQLECATRGELVVLQHGQELHREPLELGLTVDLRLLEREPAGEQGVYELQLDRIAMTGSGNGALEVETSLAGLRKADRFLPAGESGLGPMLQAAFAAPVERLRFPAAGELAVREERGGGAHRQLSDLDLASLLLLLQPCFPAGGRVAPGARWRARRRLPLNFETPQPVELELEYELRAVEGDQATLGVAGRVELRDLAAVDVRGGGLAVHRLVYECAGALRFDAGRGRPGGGALELVIEQESAPEGMPPGGALVSRCTARYELARRAE